MNPCALCTQDGGILLWRDAHLRVVRIVDDDHPGYCRVIWNTHVREMTDLPASARAHCMAAVFAVEQALRAVVQPDKINLAALGNQMPHLHWHIIPRWSDDPQFPDPIWANARRVDTPRRQIDDLALRQTLLESLAKLEFSRE